MITLAAITIASFSRYMRSSMMEAMTEDYVRTARAKGPGRGRVLFGHALRNALIPIITLLGLSLPTIVGGALLTETVFNYPGMGLPRLQGRDQHRRPAAARAPSSSRPGDGRRVAPRRHPLRRGRPEDPLCRATDETGVDSPATASPLSARASIRSSAPPVGASWPRCRTARGRRGGPPEECAAPDRARLRREQAGGGWPRRHRAHDPVLLPRARSSTTPTRPTPSRPCSTRPRTPRRARNTRSAPTTPASTSSAVSCSAGKNSLAASGFAAALVDVVGGVSTAPCRASSAGGSTRS